MQATYTHTHTYIQTHVISILIQPLDSIISITTARQLTKMSYNDKEPLLSKNSDVGHRSISDRFGGYLARHLCYPEDSQVNEIEGYVEKIEKVIAETSKHEKDYLEPDRSNLRRYLTRNEIGLSELRQMIRDYRTTKFRSISSKMDVYEKLVAKWNTTEKSDQVDNTLFREILSLRTRVIRAKMCCTVGMFLDAFKELEPLFIKENEANTWVAEARSCVEVIKKDWYNRAALEQFRGILDKVTSDTYLD